MFDCEMYTATPHINDKKRMLNKNGDIQLVG